jgi:hypothetical protein
MKVKYQNGVIKNEAIFSECERHRYVLRKVFISDKKELNKGKLIILLLNPSFADELLVDKANRIASNIAIKKEFNELVILNLFSIITSDSDCALEKLSKDKLSENDYFIKKELESAAQVIIAWGTKNKYTRRKKRVKDIIKYSFKNLSEVYSIKYKDNYTSHISYYISENTVNYDIVPYEIE